MVSPAGISAVFEFRGDSQLDTYSAAILNGNYRLVGTDTILLQSNGREEKLELEWDSQDRARIDDEAAGKSIELARVGKVLDSKNPLTGEWSTAREWNGKSYPTRALFSSDGKVVWMITLRAEHGRYAVQSKNIHIEIPGRPIVAGDFAVTETHLMLPNPKGAESSFERF